MLIRTYLIFTLCSLLLFCACDNSDKKSQENASVDEPSLEDFRRVEVDSVHSPEAEVETKEAESKIQEKLDEEEVVIAKPKPAKKKAVIVFDSLIYRLPDMYEGDKASLELKFTNEGNAPLSIKEVDVVCGCTTPEVPFLDILPGEKGKIGIQYNSVGKEGLQEPEITVLSNGIPRKTVLKIVVNILDRKSEKDSTKLLNLKDTLPN